MTVIIPKDDLHATAEQVARFRLITAVPVKFLVFFSLVRGRRNLFACGTVG